MTGAPRSVSNDLKRDRRSMDRRCLPRPPGALSHLVVAAFATGAALAVPGRAIDLVAVAG